MWLREVAEQAEQAAQEDSVAFPPAAEAARARLRRQAWELLRAEVATQAKRLSSGSPAEAAAARQVLETLGSFPALAGVRNPALASLPEPERQIWQAFWEEVERLLRSPIPAR
jgi:hypothetical protein